MDEVDAQVSVLVACVSLANSNLSSHSMLEGTLEARRAPDSTLSLASSLSLSIYIVLIQTILVVVVPNLEELLRRQVLERVRVRIRELTHEVSPFHPSFWCRCLQLHGRYDHFCAIKLTHRLDLFLPVSLSACNLVNEIQTARNPDRKQTDLLDGRQLRSRKLHLAPGARLLGY